MTKMTLLYQTHSPFARKVLVFAHEVGLGDTLNVVHQETSPTLRNERVFASNPLGKVPVLMTADGPPLFDSSVICEYLDTLSGREPLIPKHGDRRWFALRLQALADGLSESGIAMRWETVRRPEELRYAELAAGYQAKLDAGYRFAAAAVAENAELSIGTIALATTLSWLEFRGLPTFRANHPELGQWLDQFSLRGSMRATPLEGETVDS